MQNDKKMYLYIFFVFTFFLWVCVRMPQAPVARRKLTIGYTQREEGVQVSRLHD
jgi:hypothetical protein